MPRTQREEKYERTVKKVPRAIRRLRVAINFLDGAAGDLPIDDETRRQLVLERQRLEDLVERLEES
jgi:hypothetical protein